MSKQTKPSYSFEFKRGVVIRFLAGESKVDLAREFDLSSPKLVETWARKYRNEGEDALRPKPRGRPTKPTSEASEPTEIERLEREIEQLRAENAYLGKLQALMEQRRQS